MTCSEMQRCPWVQESWICKDKGKCSCGSLIGKNVIELKKLTELLEVTPEILVDDDEVSEIENQRLEMSAPTI